MEVANERWKSLPREGMEAAKESRKSLRRDASRPGKMARLSRDVLAKVIPMSDKYSATASSKRHSVKSPKLNESRFDGLRTCRGRL